MTTTITLPNGTRIHLLQTGSVAIHPTHREWRGPAALRLPAILLDWRWTTWLPIYCWVIEHAEGVFVLDTGETAAMNDDPHYLDCDPPSRFVYRRILRVRLTADDEIGPQMQRLGIDPATVRTVVLTHLHSDHVGGLRYFPNSTFYVPRADYPESQGTLPCVWPRWFAPTFPAFGDGPIGAFADSHALTAAGDLCLLPTPGHSPGHHSLLVRTGTRDLLLAGDASFDLAQVQSGRVAGIAADVPAARRTLATLRAHLAAHPTVYMPSHDPQTPHRLQSAA